MTPENIREIVIETIRQDRIAHAVNTDEAILKTISTILTSFGIDDDERTEIKEDFRYLRRWRKTADRVTSTGITAIVTLVIGGILSALWLGVRAMLGK